MSAGGREANGDTMSREDVEALMELRRHVKRMQAGTPLLLRTVAASGQEELQICTFSVTPDLLSLRWQDQEGKGTVHEAPLSAIVDVQEDSAGAPPADDDDTEGHHALLVKLRNGGREDTMNLICASPEDLVSWRDGLKFLVSSACRSAAASPLLRSPAGAASSRGSPSGAAAAAVAAAAAAGRGGAPGPKARAEAEDAGLGVPSAATLKPQSGALDFKEQAERLREENGRLRQENEVLHDTVRRRDTTIAELLRELQGRAAAADRCSKTESTSRESDIHLRDREVTVLQQKNQRLRKTLRAKQQTISELLNLVGRVTSQQGAESSAVDDVGADEDSDKADESPVASTLGRQGRLQSEAAPAAPAALAASAARRAKPGQRPHVGVSQGTSDAEEEEEDRHEAPAAARGAGAAARRFQPAPRAAAPGARTAAAASAVARAPAPAPRAPAPAPAPAPAAAAAAGAAARGSAAALEVLDRELTLLEEKKRVVERLARNLEPPSDNEEEDDGFPLR